MSKRIITLEINADSEIAAKQTAESVILYSQQFSGIECLFNVEVDENILPDNEGELRYTFETFPTIPENN